MLRVPGCLYRPLRWLTQPRRAALLVAVLATLLGALAWAHLDGVLRALAVAGVVVYAALAYRLVWRVAREEREG